MSRSYTSLLLSSIKEGVFTWIGIIWVSLLSASSSTAETLDSIDDLALGVALFEYYQQNDFDALSELMVSEETGRITAHKAFAHRLQSGIYLNYGMESEVLSRLSSAITTTENSGERENIARLHYFLGQLLYNKGQYQSGLLAFKRVSNDLSDELRAEMSYLVQGSLIQQYSGNKVDNEDFPANAIIAESEISGKEFDPERLKRMGLWGNYTDYNQSVLKIKATTEKPSIVEKDAIAEKKPIAEKDSIGEQPNTKAIQKNIRALESLASVLSKKISKSQNANDSHALQELLALRDRTLLTIAYLYLMQNDSSRALEHLSAYSAEGADKEEALFAYGWAYFHGKQYNDAIKAWGVLANGDMTKPATREALFSLGHLYEEQNLPTKAVEAFNLATKRFKAELAVYNTLTQRINEDNLDSLWQALLPVGTGWLNPNLAVNAGGFNEDEVEVLKRLGTLTSSNAISTLMNQKHDIQWLKGRIQEWDSAISALLQATDNHRLYFDRAFDQGYVERLEATVEQQRKALISLQENVASLDLQADLQAGDYVSLMKESELNRYQKLKAIDLKATKLLKELPTDEVKTTAKLRSQQKQIALLTGYSQWLVEDVSVARQWKLKKDLATAENHLNENRNTLNFIKALIPEQQSQTQSIAKVEHLKKQLERIKKHLVDLDAQSNQRLVSLSVDALQQQRDIIQSQLAQVQYAKARIMDEQYMLTQPENAAVEANDSRSSAL